MLSLICSKTSCRMYHINCPMLHFVVDNGPCWMLPTTTHCYWCSVCSEVGIVWWGRRGWWRGNGEGQETPCWCFNYSLCVCMCACVCVCVCVCTIHVCTNKLKASIKFSYVFCLPSLCSFSSSSLFPPSSPHFPPSFLDLSFNNLLRIENLESLVKLEKLFFIQNKISAIGNLSTLTCLTMLELGSNRIRVSWADALIVTYWAAWSLTDPLITNWFSWWHDWFLDQATDSLIKQLIILIKQLIILIT